jgi:hypothetical protein
MSAQDAVRAPGAADDRRRGLRRIDLRRLSRVALLGSEATGIPTPSST